MTNISSQTNQDLSQQLQQIQQQLTEMGDRLTRLEQQKTDSSVEDQLLMIGDIYRYGQLQQYLMNQQWSEADLETIDLILEITDKDIESLTPEDISSFPCNQLMVIDGLWQKYSNGHFGFTPQVETYQAVGGDISTTIEQNQQIVIRWGQKLGWRDGDVWLKCSDLEWSLDAPRGCHPSRWWNSPYGSKMTNFFLGRLMRCNIQFNSNQTDE